MHVPSVKLGDLEVDEDTILTFPQGLLGFGDTRRFALVDTHDSGLYFWMQSLEHPELAFLTTIPWPFFPDYEPALSDADREALDLHDASDAMVLCLLTVDREAEGITANLLGPVVINATTRVARQVVLADSRYSTRVPLAQS